MESYWRLKRPFYWILFLTIQEYIWMKLWAHEGLTGKTVHIATLCREVTRLGLNRQSIRCIILQHSEIGELFF